MDLVDQPGATPCVDSRLVKDIVVGKVLLGHEP